MLDKLEDYDLNSSPLETFKTWLEKAQKSDAGADAFSLATIDLHGGVSNRILLLKDIIDSSLYFVSNYESEKAKEIKSNSQGAIVFYWKNLERQVRIKGTLRKSTSEWSEKYFLSRGLESQVASMISTQSSLIESRSELEDRFHQKLEAIKQNKIEITRPESWGGYFLEASEWEFFIYGEHRLNDRFRYRLETNNEWRIERLSP